MPYTLSFREVNFLGGGEVRRGGTFFPATFAENERTNPLDVGFFFFNLYIRQSKNPIHIAFHIPKGP